MVACGSDDESSSSTDDHVIAVEFDGSQCTAGEPSTVPAGHYTFVYTNLSDRDDVHFYVRSFVDGHTYTELIAAQQTAGGEGADFLRPAWVHTPVLSFERPQLELEDNQRQHDHVLEPGPHGMLVAPDRPPRALWLCGPLDVTNT